MKRFLIGDITVELDLGSFTLDTDNLISLFEDSESIKDKKISFQLCAMDQDLFYNAECLRKTGGFELLRVDGRLFLMNHWARLRFGYGIWLDDLKMGTTIPVWVNPRLNDEIPLAITRMLSTIGLHSKLLQHRAPVLHASYIDYRGKGIIFSAPSGTGKSTQAALWEQFAGAEIINGDRVLLSKREGKWYTHGYPCCGSSMICVNRSIPLSAIVVLEQGQDNTIERLSISQIVRTLCSATEVYIWDSEEIDLSLSVGMEIASEIPVLKLTCTPDKRAVEVLKQYLEGMQL